MTTTRRSVLAAAGASLALPHIAAATGAAGATLAETVADIIRSSEEGNAALMQGDIPSYEKLVRFNDDFLLMSPFGGEPTRAADYTPERMASMGRFFRNGSFTQEVLQAYASDDMVVLATIERTNAEVGGLPPRTGRSASPSSIAALPTDGGWHIATPTRWYTAST